MNIDDGGVQTLQDSPETHKVGACSKGRGQDKHVPLLITHASGDMQRRHYCSDWFASGHESCVCAMYGKSSSRAVPITARLWDRKTFHLLRIARVMEQVVKARGTTQLAH